MNELGSVFTFVGIGLATCVLAPNLAEGFKLISPVIKEKMVKKLHAK